MATPRLRLPVGKQPVKTTAAVRQPSNAPVLQAPRIKPTATREYGKRPPVPTSDGEFYGF